MFCNYCGTRLPEEALFCNKCGKQQKEVVNRPAPAEMISSPAPQSMAIEAAPLELSTAHSDAQDIRESIIPTLSSQDDVLDPKVFAASVPSLPTEVAIPSHQTPTSTEMARSTTPPKVVVQPNAKGRVKPARRRISLAGIMLTLALLVILALVTGIIWLNIPHTSEVKGITEFALPSQYDISEGIVAGSDGNLWFTETQYNKIGRISTSGTITEFPVLTANPRPLGITSGPDGALWFTESQGNKIGRITTSETITEFPLPTGSSGLASSQPFGITAGSDGAL